MPCRLTPRGLLLTTRDHESDTWNTEKVDRPLRYLYVHTEIEPGTTFGDVLNVVTSDIGLRRFVDESFWCDTRDMAEEEEGEPLLMEIWDEIPEPIVDEDGKVVGFKQPDQTSELPVDSIIIAKKFNISEDNSYVDGVDYDALLGVRGRFPSSGGLAEAAVDSMPAVRELQLSASSVTLRRGESTTPEEFKKELKGELEEDDNHEPLTFFDILFALFDQIGDVSSFSFNETQAMIEDFEEMRASPMIGALTFAREGQESLREWFFSLDEIIRPETIKGFEKLVDKVILDDPDNREPVEDALALLRQWVAEEE